MCFALKNAPYCFSKLISELLNDFEEFAVRYIYDVAVFSNTWEEHVKHLSLVLDKIEKKNLKIKLLKCKFAQKHIKYSGHIVAATRSPAYAKIENAKNFPTT